MVHFGLPSGPVVAPPLPTVFECVDATLAQLSHRHYKRATGTPAIIHCQTSRIASRLESTWRHASPSWLIRVNPCCFARYPAKVERERARTIVFCGRFHPEKSPLLLVEAVGELAARGIEFRTEMLASGPLERQMSQFVAKNGLGHRVFIGHSNDTSANLANASIFVSVQQSDNYPSQSLLEAMGSGCTVVASDVGETWRLVDERVGIRVPLDRGALADALQQLLSNPGRTDELGQRARDRVREHFSADRYVAFLEDLYFEARERWMNRERLRRKADPSQADGSCLATPMLKVRAETPRP